MNATTRSARTDPADPEPDEPAMESTRGHALATGVFFIAAAIAAIAGLVLYGPLLNHADYVIGAGADTRIHSILTSPSPA